MMRSAWPLLVIIACCLYACSKKSNSVSVKPANVPTHDSLAIATPRSYPYTDTYSGRYYDSAGTYYPFYVTVQPQFEFYIVHISDTTLAIITIGMDYRYNINDTFRKNSASIYTVGDSMSYIHRSFHITADSLYGSLQFYNSDPCPDGTFYFDNYAGTVRSATLK